MARNGFIVLWRQALESWLFDLPDAQFKVTMRILLEANWKQTTALRNGKQFTVLRGQALISEQKLAERCGRSRGCVRKTLLRLEKIGFLGRKTDQGVTVLTILKYSEYQDRREEGDPEWDPRGIRVGSHHNKGTREPVNNSKSITFDLPIRRLAWLLASLIADRLPDSKEALKKNKAANGKRWQVPIEKLHRIDEQPIERIEAVLRWSQQDDFWSRVILSGTKLRRQFTKLLAAMPDVAANPLAEDITPE